MKFAAKLLEHPASASELAKAIGEPVTRRTVRKGRQGRTLALARIDSTLKDADISAIIKKADAMVEKRTPKKEKKTDAKTIDE